MFVVHCGPNCCGDGLPPAPAPAAGNAAAADTAADTLTLQTLLLLVQVPPQLAALLPNLAALLKRGRDAPQTFPLVEAYLLLGAAHR
jgi:hypothetical protein